MFTIHLHRKKKKKRLQSRHILSFSGKSLFGKSLSAQIRLRQSPLPFWQVGRFGIVLAFAAWLMQLSVFLTPILSHQIRVGYGVCEELAVFSQETSSSQQTVQTDRTHSVQSSQSSSQPNQSMTMSMDMSGMPDMPMMSMPQAEIPHTKISEHKADSQAPPNQQSASSNTVSTSVVSHDLHHALCNFCFLFGHSVLPPVHTITFVLVAIIVTVYAVRIDAIQSLFFKYNKNLRPQGRAPPQFIR